MRLKKNKVNFTNWLFASFLIFLFSFFIPGCSSAPPRTGEVFSDRNTALNQLNLANQLANRGRFEDALLLLMEARRLAVSTDDPSLRVRTAISRGNFLFYLGSYEEAFSEWDTASAEGDSSGEPALAALARIYLIRARIMMLANEDGGASAASVTGAEELKTKLEREMILVRNDEASTAAGQITLGFAERQLGRWAEAEREVRRALDFHQRNNNLEDAAYCWFIIGSIRSFAGNYDSSLEALRTAISLDRRAENGFGLASSWRAMGDVYQKAGRAQESREALQRAAEIYRAINLDEHAEALESEL